ncbi:MAG: NAD(P)/FAD-dependent oxidoreductase [Oryzomonas sp.]|uniref:NAD(P)/FAD-dependent oxidoreductase n=1 Tax=Oryzomonas sp. TaxID=2855186 RepID=UPI00283B9F94|nr:NAD(P)/FAD-dependent oxidoreductase [Oryzomonas sp.]MDR3579833.1 NAD(P)/FAD-dependent oxidoreductase [Oryzomonas sp.]
MESCDVLIVGAGPAGSTCAGRLAQAGLDVLLLDRQVFPRAKPCAGWITPSVLETLAIDPEEYGQGRVLQPIANFRTGLIHGPDLITRYGRTVSYGILRSEFDHYLVQRSVARLVPGEPVTVFDRKNGGWLVNGRIRARLLVGAGGHYCPVARFLGARIGHEPVIAAQVTELAMTPDQERLCRIPADTPALFFCRDMKGYGWLFRKGKFLNVGLGRMDTNHLGSHMKDFCTFLEGRGYLAPGSVAGIQGHAYRLYQRQGGRARVGDGVLLIGDAAGLAQPQSGEGILAAIESALLASDAILTANGDYGRNRLRMYNERLSGRFGVNGREIPASPLLSGPMRFLGARLLSSRWFCRNIVLDRWFLHKYQQALYAAPNRESADR